jgi:hypothetical protein
MSSDFDGYIRELCRRATATADEEELQDLLGQLRLALSDHINGLRGMVASHVLGAASHPRWNDFPENDAPLSNARQPYFQRERESAEGFVTWVRLITPKAPGKSGNPH